MFDKQALRLKMEQLREQLNPGQKAQLDALLCLELQTLVLERAASAVHTFLPMGTEIDLYPFISWMLDNNIAVSCPKTMPERKLQHFQLRSPDEIKQGLFGTFYPDSGIATTGPYDLIVVPGLAFDQHNNRLGYGGGYYDIFLREHPKAFKVGVGYNFQVITDLPVEPHDVPLDRVIA